MSCKYKKAIQEALEQFSLDYEKRFKLVTDVLKASLRVPGEIVACRADEQTGMIHLCPSEKGVAERRALFVPGTPVMIEPAHWAGTFQVFRAYKDDGEFNYFDDREVAARELESLWQNYPSAYWHDWNYFQEWRKIVEARLL